MIGERGKRNKFVVKVSVPAQELPFQSENGASSFPYGINSLFRHVFVVENRN